MQHTENNIIVLAYTCIDLLYADKNLCSYRDLKCTSDMAYSKKSHSEKKAKELEEVLGHTFYFGSHLKSINLSSTYPVFIQQLWCSHPKKKSISVLTATSHMQSRLQQEYLTRPSQ